MVSGQWLPPQGGPSPRPASGEAQASEQGGELERPLAGTAQQVAAGVADQHMACGGMEPPWQWRQPILRVVTSPQQPLNHREDGAGQVAAVGRNTGSGVERKGPAAKVQAPKVRLFDPQAFEQQARYRFYQCVDIWTSTRVFQSPVFKAGSAAMQWECYLSVVPPCTSSI